MEFLTEIKINAKSTIKIARVRLWHITFYLGMITQKQGIKLKMV
jgi:hypothetical protein